MTYPLTFYTDKFVPEGSGACVRVLLLPFILIRPKCEEDEGIYQHELTHVKQAFRCILPPIHALIYQFNEKYRLKCEVEAYKKQLKYYEDDRTAKFAYAIANKYDLDVTMVEAVEMLR